MSANKTARRRATGIIAATSISALVLAGCSSDGNNGNGGGGGGSDEEFDVANGISTTYEFQNVPDINPVPEGAGLGTEDQEIGEVGDELNTPSVSDVIPIGPDWMITTEYRDNERVWSAIDPEDGVVKTRIVTGKGIWDDVVHVYTTDDASQPQAVAFEVWAPRGSRGNSDFTVSTYSGNLLEPEEINLPKHVRFHSREGSHTLAGEGKYLVSWDDQLFGVRVVDLEEGALTGELQLVGCGPYTWPVGNTIYSVCETSGELLELTIDDSGQISETARSQVLPDDFTAAREAHFADETKEGFLISEAGDVYVFDFSDGLPSDPIEPVGNVGRDEGRFHHNGINPDGSKFFVTYTDSEIHPVSANGGDLANVRLFDTEGAEETADLSAEDLGLESIDSAAFNMDGSVLYVLGDAPGDDDETVTTLVGVDPATGDVISDTEVTGYGGSSVSGLMAPVNPEDN